MARRQAANSIYSSGVGEHRGACFRRVPASGRHVLNQKLQREQDSVGMYLSDSPGVATGDVSVPCT